MEKVSFLYEKKTLSFAVAEYLWDFGETNLFMKNLHTQLL